MTKFYAQIIMKIILLRHGKPNLVPSKKISANDFTQWINDYNHAQLCSDSLPQDAIIEQTKNNALIISSTLRRSIDSAQKLQPAQVIISDALFNEAEMPSTTWLFPKLPTQIWAIAFRLAWRLGFTGTNNVESFKQASSRARLAANELIQHAKHHDEIILVGHGIFNRLLTKQLKSSDWSLTKPLGTGYWSYGVLQKHS